MLDEMPVQPVAETPKKANTGLIIGVAVVIVLCCCCLLIGGGAYYYITNSVQNVFSSINESLLTPVVPELPEIPAFPTDEAGVPAIPSSPELPAGFDDLIPQGGLGDDILRTDTWVYVMAGAATSGCTVTEPSATTIEVLTQPDAATGLWQEKWTVTCDDDTSRSFEVTFVPSSQGGTDINVKEIK